MLFKERQHSVVDQVRSRHRRLAIVELRKIGGCAKGPQLELGELNIGGYIQFVPVLSPLIYPQLYRRNARFISVAERVSENRP